MLRYFLRRIWNGLLVLFGVITLVFLIFGLKPGDPARMLADQRSSPEALAAIRKDLGLDLSPGKRYLLYLNDISPIAWMQDRDPAAAAYLDTTRYSVIGAVHLGVHVLVFKAPYLRYSYQSRRGVATILAEAFPNTALLAIVAMFFAVVVGVGMGTIAAVRKGTPADDALLFISALGMAGPSFFMAVLIAWLGGYVWYAHIHLPVMLVLPLVIWVLLQAWNAHGERRVKDRWAWGLPIALFTIWVGAEIRGLSWASFGPTLPGTGLPMTGGPVDVDPFRGEVFRLRNLVLPTIVLGIRPLAVIVQLTRSSLLSELERDHIRTARAIGLGERAVVLRHGLRNALMPVLTAVSGWFASLLAGAVFIEYVFGWRGMGLEVFNALEREDLPVVMGAVLVFATIFVVMNVVVDLLYGVLDPRVRTV
ncbi:MAG: ABC transporter permease [Flavobacteriales bacterium]|nr:ABC transporter permease [Flavobacteriales bacterium]MCB9168061.1 ABC transporter permease [Flavobacteriales bacterium]